MKKKFDNTPLGIVIGVAAPLILFFIIMKYIQTFEFADKSLQNMWLYVTAPKVISLGAIPNLAFFLLFAYTNRLRSARGVLGATIFYAIIVLIFRFMS